MTPTDEPDTDKTQRRKEQDSADPGCLAALRRVQQVFTELCEALQQHPLNEEHVFRLTRDISLANLRKRHFLCTTRSDQHSEIQRCVFSYQLQGKHDYNIKLVTKAEASLLLKALTERHIRFQCLGPADTDSPQHTLVNITPSIQTRFIFAINDDQLHLTILNYDGMKDQTLKFKPERLSDEFIDEIARYALHQDNNFLELTGQRLSLNLLEKLRAQILRAENRKHPQPEKHRLLDLIKRLNR